MGRFCLSRESGADQLVPRRWGRLGSWLHLYAHLIYWVWCVYFVQLVCLKFIWYSYTVGTVIQLVQLYMHSWFGLVTQLYWDTIGRVNVCMYDCICTYTYMHSI